MVDPTTVNAPTFEFFGRDHLTALAAVAIVTTACSVVLRVTARVAAEHVWRSYVCWSVVGIMVAAHLYGQVYHLQHGTWTLDEGLPLHLCDIGVYVTAVALLGVGTRRDRLRGTRGPLASGELQYRCYELAYFWGLGGTVQALLTPELNEPFPAIMTIRYFISHGGIVVGVLMLTLGLGMRPRPAAPRRVWLVTFALATCVMLINWALDTNYMYLCGPPERPSLIDYFGPWPWSLLTLVGVGTVIFALLYSPFWIADRVRGRGRLR